MFLFHNINTVLVVHNFVLVILFVYPCESDYHPPLSYKLFLSMGVVQISSRQLQNREPIAKTMVRVAMVTPPQIITNVISEISDRNSKING